MNKNYIVPNEWSIIEEGFNKENVKSSESIFSIGNGSFGQRANFEENYSGATLQGSYIGGIYYPDKTRVGWWKNGYPEYFAKVLNAPNWIGIQISINQTELDLNLCEVSQFKRELNMKEGWLKRSFIATLSSGNQVEINATRFISIPRNEIGAIKYAVKAVNFSGKIQFKPYLDAGIVNQDANYDEYFWETLAIETGENSASIWSKTLKTNFGVGTAMQVEFKKNGELLIGKSNKFKEEKKVGLSYDFSLEKGDEITIYKYASYVTTLNHPEKDLVKTSLKNVAEASAVGFNKLLAEHKLAWNNIWKSSDIQIEGDITAQQGIRFNIFQLNQTYLGTDSRLNIGPKGFTGEKYGGSTYWDTEAYCIPFYMATKDESVAENLLKYRYNQLDKAIENAEKLGFKNGAALYPMVTMNGEECHNEWEITFE
ncbi:MAG: glycoside hydrolase family 65 protein, partial [Lutibacter sp.]